MADRELKVIRAGVQYKVKRDLKWQAREQTDTLALLPLVKRQVFCIGDRLKMDKHKAWATMIVEPKSGGHQPQKDR